MSLILITSGAFVDGELVAEFGALPPAFLPVGHQRLYEAQMESLKSIDGDIVLTLPESFKVPQADEKKLEALNVKTLRVPEGMKLGESVLFALNVLSPGDGPIRILHGDTLLRETLPDESDLVVVAAQPENYDWGTIELESTENELNVSSSFEILAGYFAFSSEAQLRRSLAKERCDFVKALRAYDAITTLKRVHTDNWLDFGHLQTYYRSRCSIHTQRSFNELNLSFKSVRKSSANPDKILAEAFWFENIPKKLRLYTPAFLGLEKSINPSPAYSLEYLPLPTLHELFVFGDLSQAAWRLILGSCNDFLMDCQIDRKPFDKSDSGALATLTRDKTNTRLDEFCAASGINRNDQWRLNGRSVPSLSEISNIASDAIDYSNLRMTGIMHGDLCFTNIFYDFRTQRIRVIDPRGAVGGGEPTIWGDSRYDIAKMAHSIIGGYDFILADRYTCNGIESRDVQFEFFPSNSMDHLQDLAKELTFLGVNLLDPEAISITIHLFLSMLPLHNDSPRRQKAFIASALRLFTFLERQL